ncbi:hypothetical protein A4A49_04919 [Nicotiana attenuata]|uniref:Uncharacterized protein n=1 Tax=Nicotiana attenuata TaxID=49451 RepID=A0A1J6IQU8_NICAT|nr:hypothetical protein A4A49_04919 [Nicotiana attenuata]
MYMGATLEILLEISRPHVCFMVLTCLDPDSSKGFITVISKHPPFLPPGQLLNRSLKVYACLKRGIVICDHQLRLSFYSTLAYAFSLKRFQVLREFLKC